MRCMQCDAMERGQDYNMRSYVRRRVREDFRKFRNASGAEAEAAWNEGRKQFEVVKR